MKNDTSKKSHDLNSQRANATVDTAAPSQNKAQKKLVAALKKTEEKVAPGEFGVVYQQIFQEVLQEVLYLQKAEWEATSRMERDLRLANPVEDSNSLIPFDSDGFGTLVGRLAWIRAIKQLCMSLGLGEYIDEIVQAEMGRVYQKPSKE